QTVCECRVVFVSSDFLRERAGQADDVVGRDTALLRIKPGQVRAVERGFVVNDNGRRGERLLRVRGCGEKQQNQDMSITSDRDEDELSELKLRARMFEIFNSAHSQPSSLIPQPFQACRPF